MILSLTLNQGHWNADTGENDLVRGKGHSNQVQDMMVVDGVLITCGMDDSIVYTDVATKQYGQVDSFTFFFVLSLSRFPFVLTLSHSSFT